VTFTAVGDTGYLFSYWTGLPTLVNPYTFDVDNNYTIGAVFYENGVDTVWTLTDGAIIGHGTVYIGIAGGPLAPFTSEVTLISGTIVTLWAEADSGDVFSHWLGILSSGLPILNDPYTFAVDNDYEIGADFEADTGSYTLTSGAIVGDGEIYISIDGGAAVLFASEIFSSEIPVTSAMSVTFTVTIGAGYAFSYWTGLPTLDDTYSFTPARNYVIGAVFCDDTAYTLTPGAISESMIGGVSIPDGSILISINYAPAVPFNAPVTVIGGTTVTFTATGNPGYLFSYWIGLQTFADPYTFNVDDDYTIGAAFYLNGSSTVYRLIPGAITGDGSITISIADGSPILFNAPVILDGGTSVTFTATGNGSYDFSYWTGLQTLANPYTFNVNGNNIIGAVFCDDANAYTLTPGTATNGSISISINGAPAIPFNEPVTLKEGTPVTFTATGNAGYLFSYWTGLSTFANPYTLTVNADDTIGAVFYSNSSTVYTLTPGAATNGSVTVNIGGTEIPFDAPVTLIGGTSVTFTAVGNTGYLFSYWTGLSTFADTYTFDIDNNYTIGAVFYSGMASVHTLTPGAVIGDGSVSISINGAPAIPFDAPVKLMDWTSVTFTATGNGNYMFSYWTGLSTFANPYTFVVSSDITIGAVFYENGADKVFTLTPGTATNGSVTVNIDGAEIPFDAPVTLIADTPVTFTATANMNYTFSYWTGLPTLENPYTFDIDNNYTVGAVFYSNSSTVYTLTDGIITGDGSISISINGAPAIPFDSPLTVIGGTSVTFTATGIGNSKFSYWTGLSTFANPCTFVVSSDLIVGAVFYLNGSDPVYSVIPGTITGDGTMSISINDAAAVPFDATLTLKAGTKVTILAEGIGTYKFLYWVGLPSFDEPYTISSLDKNYEIDVVFYDAGTETVYTLTPRTITGGAVYISIDGGTEMLFDSPIDVVAGTSVTFRAAGVGNYKFSYWTGLTTLANPYTFTVNGDMTIGAVFYLNGSDLVYKLVPGTATNGSMTVSIDGGAAIPFDSAVTVISGTSVTFTAIGNGDYMFSYWTGLPLLANPCAFDVYGDYTIGAVFYENGADTVYTLTPGVISGGAVYISINGGVEMLFDSPVDVISGTTVTFRAADVGNYKFSYWTGLTTLANSYTFTVSGDMTIGAVFYLSGTDTVHKITPGTITGNGTIYITIGNGNEVIFDTQVTVKDGTSVTFTAVAGDGYVFKQWSGDVSGTTETDTVRVTSDMTVSAEFSVPQSAFVMPGWLVFLIMLLVCALVIALMYLRGTRHRPYNHRHLLGALRVMYGRYRFR
jgi:hypothetical protein